MNDSDHYRKLLKLPGICCLAVFFCACHFIGQAQDVQLLSSYSGRITDIITITKHNMAMPFDADMACDSLHLDPVNCCPLRIVEDEVRISEHEDYLMNPVWETVIGRTSGLMSKLNKLHDEWKKISEKNVDRGTSDDYQRIVDLMIRAQTLAPSNEVPLDPSGTHTWLALEAKKFTKLDTVLTDWWKNRDKKDSTNVGDRLKYDSAYRSLVEQAYRNYYQPKNGCHVPFINVVNYCAGDTNCTKYIHWLTSNYAQDHFYGLEKKDDSLVYGITDPKVSWDVWASEDGLSDLVKCQCGSLQQGKTFGIDMAGGNILVGDGFVLIGRDDLENQYLDLTHFSTHRRLAALGITDRENMSKDTLAKTVTDSLEKKICLGKKIIWVGHEKPRQRYYSVQTTDGYGFAPFYHIDLFISLLGPDEKNPDGFGYVLSIPTLNVQDLQATEPHRRIAYELMISDLRASILEVAAKMEDEVRHSVGVDMKRTVVPLPVLLKEFECDKIPPRSDWMENAFSFSNGLVENVGNEIHYFMPDYPSVPSESKGEVKYEHAITTAIGALNGAGVRVKRITGRFGPKLSGLHCIVKVLGRSD